LTRPGDEAFSQALQQIDEWIQPQGVKGCGAAVWYHGSVVAEHYVGEAEPGKSVTPETLFALASVTKPVAAATVMTAVEDGAFSLDEPVSRFVPEFLEAVEGEADPTLQVERSKVTIRHLLCHTSGLPEDIVAREARLMGMPTLAELTDRHCHQPLLSRPGSVIRYSNTGYAILARALERATGEDFWDRCRNRVLAPADLSDIVVRPESNEQKRIATVDDAASAGTPAESYNSPYWRELAIPWGGLYGTPRNLAQFAATFLPSATDALPTTSPVLSCPTRSLMIRDQTGGVPGGVESGRVWWAQGSWGLGWEVRGTKRRHWTGDLASPATFCHFGRAGTLVCGDPARDVALTVFTNRSVARMRTFILTHWIQLSNAVATAAGASYV
jgi:CubicO group peptidase (beta-lactamase class C family)